MHPGNESTATAVTDHIVARRTEPASHSRRTEALCPPLSDRRGNPAKSWRARLELK